MAGRTEGVVTALLGLLCLLLLTLLTCWTPGGQDPPVTSLDLMILACMSFTWSFVYLVGVWWERLTTCHQQCTPVIKYQRVSSKANLDNINKDPFSREHLLHGINEQESDVYLLSNYSKEETRICSIFLCHVLLIILNILQMEKFLRRLYFSHESSVSLYFNISHILELLLAVTYVLVVFINVTLGVSHLLRGILTTPYSRRSSLEDMAI